MMRPIPKGTYWVGAGEDDKFALDCERPRRRVTLDRDVWLGVFPVTEREMGGTTDLPAVAVSWFDAVAYCAALRAATGEPWRLPTEEEWEIACRAGSATPFASGKMIAPGNANFLYDETGNRVGPGRRTPKGSYPANAFGYEDMAGNVLEWCLDEWHPGSGTHVIRGGAWDLLPRLLRSSWRDAAPPETRRDNLGFRLAMGKL